MTNRHQQQGMAAYRLGRTLFDNPYRGPKAHSWQVGWSLAWALDDERKPVPSFGFPRRIGK